MKEKDNKKDKAGRGLFGIGMFTILAIGFTVAILFIASTGNVFVPGVEEERMWVRQENWLAVGDADPGSGASGWLNMTVYQNDSDPANYYARNLTNNASSYAWTNTNNTHGGSNVPHSTEFALWYKVRINVSDGYCVSNSTWMPTWVQCSVTSPVLSLDDESMNRYLIGSNSTYMWLAFVYNDGISISQGQNVTVCQFYVDIYQ